MRGEEVKSLKLTILVDNIGDGQLATEHGFSVMVETDGARILIDTGQGAALVPNARQLGVDLSRLDALVLSHGHYDHTGAMAEALRLAPSARVFAHPGLCVPRYSRRQPPPHKAIGIPSCASEALNSHLANIAWTHAPAQIVSGVWVTGAIPRLNGFEDTGGAFFLDPQCRKPDPIADDQALWIRTAKGLVVILGCAHAGVINTLDYIATLTGADRFYAIIGGMHLLNASPSRLEATVQALRRYRIERLVPCHCTGEHAIELLMRSFPDQCLQGHAGMRIELC